jgi:hypothetical protein
MSKDLRVSRRTVLQGLGAAVALPWLEAMAPAATAAAATPPRRLAWMYVPNGIHMADWTPKADGALTQLSWIAEPLEPFKDSLTFLTGLTCDKARANGDGPGDHARAMSAFLTGRQPRKTHGADIRAGVSADQLAAQHIGKTTKFASLELGTDRGLNAGNCDSGYSCAYSNSISWRGESTPNAKEIDPRLVFERLFGTAQPGQTSANELRREHYRKSILDYVADDARRLQARLGGADKRKLDEYLTAVREIENRITRAGGPTRVDTHGVSRPTGIPREFGEHLRLLADLMVLAFRTDQTRIGTFVFANEGSNRSYRFIGVPDGHHDLSHHGNDQEKQKKIREINRFHVEQLAYLLKKLREVKESDGSTLLDNCLIAYGSGNSDGNRHNHDDLPVLVAGKGGGSVRAGRHLRFPRETPVTNLWLAMLNRAGAPATTLGDSTGVLEGLS